ncbi:MAG: hypothetical protein AAFR70_15730, partial [Pseudomonadota bacterium]
MPKHEIRALRHRKDAVTASDDARAESETANDAAKVGSAVNAGTVNGEMGNGANAPDGMASVVAQSAGPRIVVAPTVARRIVVAQSAGPRIVVVPTVGLKIVVAPTGARKTV